MIEWLSSSCFSFLESVSYPDDLIRGAAHWGYGGVGLGDRMGLYGLVQGFRAVEELRAQGKNFFFAPGIRLHFDSADPLFVYPLHKGSWSRLCRHLSEWALDGMKVQEKGLTPLPWARFRDFLRQEAQGFVIISVPGRFFPWPEEEGEESRKKAREAQAATPTFCNPPSKPGQCPFWLLELAEICGRGKNSALSLAYPLTQSPGLEGLHAWLKEQSESLNIPLLATSLPLHVVEEDQDLCDLATAIRHRRLIKNLGFLAQANGERRLLTPEERGRWEKRLGKEIFARGYELAERQNFSLRELTYHYPRERIPEGLSPPEWLEKLVYDGARHRYPQGLPLEVEKQVRHELKLVRELEYEDYFLTIWDILSYARSQKILFQGRGSAANSALCYCLGITAIDPVQMNLLFERFLSLERREPPDIDVDFEHERREEVMQEIYRRYGREHAAMVASCICFRHRMAVRETAKALGFSLESIDGLARFMGREGMSRLQVDPAMAEEAAAAQSKELAEKLRAFKVSPRRWKRLLDLAPRLVGLPRHLGLHTGGFVLSSERLDEQCILEPARMENRSVVPWDKDDIDHLHWMKVDLLSLGMLTAIRKAFQYIDQPGLGLATLPQECPKVYRDLSRADSVGVFQVESRAQMNMLPRLIPKTFYDLVVEVAIVRPGPLQGGMVHPYLRRRQGLDPVSYDHPRLEKILKKTLGVPIFQEQVMKIAIEVADFTPGQADQLRKVMSGAWRLRSHMSELQERLMKGMRRNGLSQDFAERLYKQIEGFGEYGFPESHAASFALLTYASAWLKSHHPAEFLAGLLNSQPMGFYSPRSLVNDAERHGVKVFPPDILFSGWDTRLEPNPFDRAKPCVRLGFRLIKGFREAQALRLEALQRQGLLSFEHENPVSLEDLKNWGLDHRSLELLVAANALRSLTVLPAEQDQRRVQRWELLGVKKEDQPRLPLSEVKGESFLQPLDEWEALLADYNSTGLRTGQDPGRRFRHLSECARKSFFADEKFLSAEEVYRQPAGRRCQVVGLLSCKQRPPTAGGLTFVTLEDETGFVNLVLMPDVYESFRLALDGSMILAAEGVLEKSAAFDPQDPHSAATSLKVTRLWNPFLRTHLKNPQAILGAVREYH